MPVTNVSVVTELFFFCYVSDVASYIVPLGSLSLFLQGFPPGNWLAVVVTSADWCLTGSAVVSFSSHLPT